MKRISDIVFYVSRVAIGAIKPIIKGLELLPAKYGGLKKGTYEGMVRNLEENREIKYEGIEEKLSRLGASIKRVSGQHYRKTAGAR